MNAIQVQMKPLLQQLAKALVEGTPETWNDATLRAEVKRGSNDTIEMPHSIWSENHPQDFVTPSTEMFQATRGLQLLCEQAGQPWTALVFRVELIGKEWNFGCNFEYPPEKP